MHSSTAWPGSPPVAGRDSSAEPANDVSTTGSPVPAHQPSLRVRPYTLRDIPALMRFPALQRLDLPDSLVAPRSGYLDLPAAMPIMRRDRPTFVATADGQPVGFVRFSPRRPDGRWIVTAISASTGVYSPEPVWEALLAHGVRAAGLRGVRRLFARVPVGDPLLEAMHAAGWVGYARETLFRADRLTPQSRSPRDLRLQEAADTWAIHQLYSTSAPRPVQEIEALTSHIWHMEQPRQSRRGVRKTGWLLHEGSHLAAYGRFSSGFRAATLDVVVGSGQRPQLGALLDGIIAAPQRGRSRPVFCALRGYDLDLRDELTDRGFAEVGEQELLIRYTTATARTPAIEPVHFPVELRPAMPRRVPTFLEGQPTDGTI
jgi:hypothetical protein